MHISCVVCDREINLLCDVYYNMMRVEPSTDINVKKVTSNCIYTKHIFLNIQLYTRHQCWTGLSFVVYCAMRSFILDCFILVLIVSCCWFFSHTVEHSTVRCTSTFISRQAIRFSVSKRWLSTTSCNYVVARWTTIGENYRNGKLLSDDETFISPLIRYDFFFVISNVSFHSTLFQRFKKSERKLNENGKRKKNQVTIASIYFYCFVHWFNSFGDKMDEIKSNWTVFSSSQPFSKNIQFKIDSYI